MKLHDYNHKNTTHIVFYISHQCQIFSNINFIQKNMKLHDYNDKNTTHFVCYISYQCQIFSNIVVVLFCKFLKNTVFSNILHLTRFYYMQGQLSVKLHIQKILKFCLKNTYCKVFLNEF